MGSELQQYLHNNDTDHRQPLLALFFGSLAQDFVGFQTVLNDPTRQGDIPVAADVFRHDAALNASYLTYVGASLAWLLV